MAYYIFGKLTENNSSKPFDWLKTDPFLRALPPEDSLRKACWYGSLKIYITRMENFLDPL